MIVGSVREIKTNENRVGITPAAAAEFITNGHSVVIESNAGAGSGLGDEEYANAGATILPDAKSVFDKADMIVKVKEPQPAEFPLMRDGQIMFTYLHLAASRDLTESVLKTGSVGIAFETITAHGKLPLLEPMSEVAGKMSTLMAAHHLARPYGGRGLLPLGVTGVHSGKFVIIGGGTAGLAAAKVAANLGIRTVVMDVNMERMRYLEDVLPGNAETIFSNRYNIAKEILDADAVICTVLIPGARAPKLITRDMLSTMPNGSVLVDVSIDQGGAAETSRPTTHAEPTYEVDGVVHYCVANMPGAYARTSTFALSAATLPYGLMIANKGWKKAALENGGLAAGVNTVSGKITCKPVAEAHDMPFTHLQDII